MFFFKKFSQCVTQLKFQMFPNEKIKELILLLGFEKKKNYYYNSALHQTHVSHAHDLHQVQLTRLIVLSVLFHFI